jgi:sulfite reductase alpha subunit-like flavoprotein
MICKHREDPIKTWERRKIAWEAFSPVKLIPAAPDTLEFVEDGDRELTTSASALTLTRPKLTARDSAISISSGPSLRIHYCGSGSTARRLAQKLEHRLQVLLGKYVIPVYQTTEASSLNSLDLESSSDDDLIFIIASSSGRGDVPMNGMTFVRKYQNHRSFSATVSGLPHARFAVFGNGNSTYGPADFNGAALKIERVLSNTGLKSLVPLFHGDVSKQDPPIEQFNQFWQSILDIMTTDDILGPFSGSNGSTSLSHHEAQPEEITKFELPKVQPATFKSATGTGALKRVSLDIGQAEYGDLSHVRVYIPLQTEDLRELLSTLHLTGDEVPEVPGKATTRQILALADVSKPFTHTRWIDKEDLCTNNGNYEILTNLPFSSAILSPPVIKWLEKEGLSNPDVLSTFISAIPLVEYRTFSTASSLRAQEGSNGNNMLDLIVKIREGGGFTEEFLNRAKDGDLLYVDIRDGPSKFLVEADIPIVVFAQGAGIAPLRSLLQARVALSDQRRTDLEKITLFLAYRPDDQELVDEVIRDAECAEVLDKVYKQASNPDQIRVQEQMLRDPKAREDVRKKVVDDGANVFVIASRDASNEFEAYLGAVIGRDDVKSALDGRWDEEVFVG